MKLQVAYRGGWSWKRVLLTAAVAVALLLVFLAIDFVVRYLPAVHALQDGRDAVTSAETSAKAALTRGDAASFSAVAADLRRAETDFTSGSSVLDSGWEAAIAGHLPWLGDQVLATQAMRAAGAAGSQLGIDLLPVIQQVDPASAGAGGGVLAKLWQVASSSSPAIQAAQGDLDRLDTAIAAVPSGGLLGPLDHIRTTLDQNAATLSGNAHLALNFLSTAPSALGTSERRYLVLVSNPAEERPGGGFIGAVGEVDVQRGQILSETFADSASFDPQTPPEPAPRPLDLYLFHGVKWALSDSNWDADFPTSAKEAAHFYSEVTGHTLDGVIAVDPVALSYMLQVIGPVHVPPYPQTISATNTLLELNYITNSARPTDPGKAFLPPFAKLLFDRLLKPTTGQLSGLVGALGRGVQEKHVVLWFTDSALEKVVQGINAGGQLLTPSGDSLLVADANLSAGKDDLFVDRHFSLTATVDADGTVHDKLLLTYHNPVQTDPAKLKLIENLGNDYLDYVQVFAPSNATLDNLNLIAGGSTSPVSAENIGTEGSHAVFAYFLEVPSGQTVSLEFEYSGAFMAAGSGYQLTWEKELGGAHVAAARIGGGVGSEQTVDDRSQHRSRVQRVSFLMPSANLRNARRPRDAWLALMVLLPTYFAFVIAATADPRSFGAPVSLAFLQLGLVCAVLLIVRVREGQLDPLNPMVIFALIFPFMYALQFLILRSGADRLTSQLAPWLPAQVDAEGHAALIACLGLLCVLVGYVASTLVGLPPPALLAATRRTLDVRRRAVILCAIGVVLVVFLLVTVGGLSRLLANLYNRTQFFEGINYFAQGPLFLGAAVAALLTCKDAWPLTRGTVVLAAASLVLCLLTGSKTSLVLEVALWAGIVHQVHRRVRWRELLILFLGLTILLPFYDLYFRNALPRGVPLSQALAEQGGIGGALGRLSTDTFFGEQALTLAVTEFPQGHPFTQWNSVEALALAPIPRGVMPSKPQAPSGTFTDSFAPNFHSSGSTVPPTAMGEMYMSAGSAGVIFGCLLLGFISGAIYRRRHLGARHAALAALTAAALPLYIRGESYGVGVVYLWTLLPMLWAIGGNGEARQRLRHEGSVTT